MLYYKRKKTFPPKKLLAVLLLVSIIGFAVLKAVAYNKKNINLIKPFAVSSNEIEKNVLSLISSSFNYDDSGLSQIIKRDLNGQQGDFSIVIESLDPKNDSRFYFQENRKMPAASLYKLFLLSAAFRKIEEGKLNLEDSVTASEDHLIEVLGDSEFGYEDLEDNNITYTVAELLKRIATISDNYASIMLAEKIGWQAVQKEANTLGAKSTTIKAPITTTASDISLFWRILYQKQIISPDVSGKLAELLKLSRINDRIPKNLPEGVKIAHKTGELDGVRHDSGIVFLEGNPYLIVLLSENLKFEDDGVELFAKISKDVYDYFESQALP